MEKVTEKLYEAMYRLVPELDKFKAGSSSKSCIPGVRDLRLDVMSDGPEFKTLILASYSLGKPSVSPGLTVTITMRKTNKEAEDSPWDNNFSAGEAYDGADKAGTISEASLYELILAWLDNLIKEGHCIPFDKEYSPYCRLENQFHAKGRKIHD